MRVSVCQLNARDDRGHNLAVARELLGRAADAWGYPASFGISAGIAALALPFVWLSRRERHPADEQVTDAAPAAAG